MPLLQQTQSKTNIANHIVALRASPRLVGHLPTPELLAACAKKQVSLHSCHLLCVANGAFGQDKHLEIAKRTLPVNPNAQQQDVALQFTLPEAVLRMHFVVRVHLVHADGVLKTWASKTLTLEQQDVEWVIPNFSASSL